MLFLHDSLSHFDLLSVPAVAVQPVKSIRSNREFYCCESGAAPNNGSILPLRNSSPVSCVARRSAGQSSMSVAKIFSTIRRVSSGTKRFSITGEKPCSSARRAQYKLLESQDSASRRLE